MNMSWKPGILRKDMQRDGLQVDFPRVSYCERGIPAVLQESPQTNASGFVFYAVGIGYKLVKAGADPLQRNATEFCALLPARIDPAVAAYEIELFLQENSVVHAQLKDLGQVSLSDAEVEEIRSFTKWLFDLVLGRITEIRTSSYDEGPKRYYVVPLVESWRLNTEDLNLIIDWNMMRSGINSGLHYNNIPCAEPGSEESLEEDMFVSCDRYAYLIISIGSSNIELGARQVVASRLHRAVSYLSKHEDDYEVPKKLMLVHNLSLDECTVHGSLRGNLYRGGLRLPSVLYKLEMALLAAELRDAMDVPVSALKVLEALTSGGCSLQVSYEPLELLGDSVLKVTAGTYVYYTYRLKDSEELGAELYKLVCNNNLSALAQVRKLHQYIFADMFSPMKWLPPGLVPLGAALPMQCLSTKTLADVVEALLGACVIEGGIMAALKALRWFQIGLDLTVHPHQQVNSETLGGLTKSDLQELQEKLGYQFKNQQFLLAALNLREDAFTFKRLEFLGDAVLDYLVTRHLVTSFPKLSAGRLNTMKQATVNREHYAFVNVRHGFHVYLQKVCPETENDIAAFADFLLGECALSEACASFGMSTQNSPKVLGDMLQTIAASIYIDSDFDLQTVWKVYKSLLEPIATPKSVTLHPVSQLEALCKERSLSLSIQSSDADGSVLANVFINGKRFSSCLQEEKRVARRLAAMQALQKLMASD